jgi:hypothetical protein
MTVKVVGNRDSIVYRACCAGCGSILEFHRSDIKQGYTRDYSSKSYLYIDCPKCKMIHISNPNIENIGRVEIKEKIV